jgi:HSP20 family protein
MTHPAPRASYGWDPFTELQALRAELGRIVGGRSSAADVDVDETDDGWTVTARLPGVAPGEVVIDFEDRELRIRARSEAEVNEQQVGEAIGSRRRSFEYRVAVPGDVDPDRIDATMDHGLLTVRLPQAVRSARRQITIGRGTTATAATPAEDKPAGTPAEDEPAGTPAENERAKEI